MTSGALPPDLRGQRTLAAIVFTDGVGFSARMSADEEHTLQLIRRDLQLMSELCQRFEGHVLKTTGDGLLMYFTSAIQAVACALEIQKAVADLAASLPPKEVLSHRIGIHLGDVFFTDSDVMGNGVNIAARLQTLAEPGSICMSQTVYDVVKGGLSLQATYLGPRELKNIQEAEPVYQILLASPAAGTPANPPAPHAATPTSRQEYRHRQILLNKVKNYWVKGVLETSLHGRALMELGLEERPDAVERPWSAVWESSDQTKQTLPKGVRVTDKFEEMGAGRTLLILGEPGAGKTTTLLELARDSIARAERDINQPVPVVFNLSSWGGGKQTIAGWLVSELHSKYQVSKEIGQTWIKEQQLLLMLDGLDEVSGEYRQSCADALNRFIQDFGQTEIVVCCRLKDYEALATRLKVQGAISTHPLSQEQIQQYLAGAGSELAALTQALQEDATLLELARTPLMLSVMTLAYQGMPAADLPKVNALEDRRKHLFNAYIERMFKRRSAEMPHSKERAMRWLIWLAQQMSKHSQTMFLIERLQPSWLPAPRQKWMYAGGIGLVAGLSGGLGGGLMVLLMAGPIFGRIAGVTFGLGGGLIAALIFGMINSQITPVETVKWSGEKARNNVMSGLVVGLLVGLLLGPAGGLTVGLLGGLQAGLVEGFTVALRSGLSAGLIFVLLRGLTGSGIETSTVPNQGIWQSAKYAMIFGLIGALGLGAASVWSGIPLLCGVIMGLLFGLFGAGEACLKHFVLRLVLCSSGCLPWNCARFLDAATQLIFMQKVGGGYIFIHRLLLEHFAQMQGD